MRLLVVSLFTLGLAACAPTNISELIKSMGGDPATFCLNATGSGFLVNISRTNIQNGEVQCNGNGLTIKSQAVQLQVPASVTIQQPVGVGGSMK